MITKCNRLLGTLDIFRKLLTDIHTVIELQHTKSSSVPASSTIFTWRLFSGVGRHSYESKNAHKIGSNNFRKKLKHVSNS